MDYDFRILLVVTYIAFGLTIVNILVSKVKEITREETIMTYLILTMLWPLLLIGLGIDKHTKREKS